MTRKHFLLGLLPVPLLAQLRVDVRDEEALRGAFVEAFNTWEHLRTEETSGMYSAKSHLQWESVRKLFHDLDLIERNR